MFNNTRQAENRLGISKQVALAIVAGVLFLSFLFGGLAFVFGQNPPAASEKRTAKLPVAGDRLDLLNFNSTSTLSPLVTLSAKAASPLTAIRTSDQGNWVRIPSLNVRAPLVEAKSMADTDVLNSLADGVAMYPNGIAPGENGNVFIAGHSTGEPWKGPYRFAFMNINKLKKNDTVIIDYLGNRFTYVVTDSRIINPNDNRFIDSSGKTPTLSLMACWPLWTAKNRMIIETKLIAINPLINVIK
jgi:LPXTG-site transpeptidase (sortase) family protein